VQGDLDDVVQQPIGGGLAEAFPPSPQLPDLERVDNPEAPQGEGEGGWQVDADLDEAADNDDINDNTFVIQGNGNRVLDAGQLDPDNGEHVGGNQEVLAGEQQRLQEADKGEDDGGAQGGLARGEQDAQGQIVAAPGSILSPGNSPPQRVAQDPNGPRARQLRLQQKKDEVNQLRVLQEHAQQGDFEILRQANQDREDAQKQAKQKLAAQEERTQHLEERKRIKKREADTKKSKSQGEAKRGTEDGGEAFGWVPVLMRDDQGHVMYHQEGHMRYLPHNGPAKKKKKPPPRRPDSRPSPTTPMATSTPSANRTSTRMRTTPHHLRDYVHGTDLDSDSLGFLPIDDYI
jgi:hypothetical protein